MRIAIVTFEYEGITKNGGIGTAYRRLAELLQQEKHSVSIIFLPYLDLPAKKIEQKFRKQIELVRNNGIDLILPNFFEFKKIYTQDSFINARSQAVYEYLKHKHFDIIHGADTGALLHRCLGAKLSGREFQETKFVLGAHGSSLWTSIANQAYAASDLQLAAYDKASMALADQVISPSEYMRKFLHHKKWRASRKTQVIPNVNSFDEKKIYADNFDKKPSIQSLIFFGRLEKRKGLHMFTEAVLLLLKNKKQKGIKNIFFLGSVPTSKNESITKIRSKFNAHAAALTVHFLTNKSAAEARSFLKERSEALVCLPSLLDNSPYTVVEAIEDGLNFICTDSGGQRELIAPKNYRHVLFSPNSVALQKKIEESLRTSKPPIEPSLISKKSNKIWRELHRTKMMAQASSAHSDPKISIFIGVFSLPASEELVKSYASILNQTYKNIEIWIPENFQYQLTGKNNLRIRTFQGDTLYEKIKGATGKYLLFLDGIQFYDDTSLMSTIRSMEAASRKVKKIICHTPDLEIKVGKATQVETLRPFTREFFGAACAVAKAHSIWDTKIFVRHAKKQKVTPNSELQLHNFCLNLVKSGFEFSTIPCLYFRDSMDIELRKKVQEDFLMKNAFLDYHAHYLG